jgi:hypothetical protein
MGREIHPSITTRFNELRPDVHLIVEGTHEALFARSYDLVRS